MKKNSVIISLIFAVTAICITLIICGKPEMMMAVISIIAGAVIIIAFIKGFFSIF